MLFEQRLWSGLADGSVTVTFRRWKRPRARVGGRHRTPAGVLAVDAVAEVDPAALTEDDARAAGFGSLAALLRQLDRHGDGPVYRVDFHHAGADPREALRQADQLSEEELAGLRACLARLDLAARDGPWTIATLRLIGDRPGVRAADLAAAAGRERLPFKADVRKLKELGLTESLEVGYRLSPRGRRCWRDSASRPGPRPARTAVVVFPDPDRAVRGRASASGELRQGTRGVSMAWSGSAWRAR